MKTAALVTLADKNWIEYAKPLFAGAHFRAGWKHDYILLAVNVSENDTKWFSDRGVIVYNCPSLEEYTGVHSSTLTPTMYRLWMFTDFFKQWRHLVFLDADIIIRGQLDHLLDVEKFAAISDCNRNSLDWQLRGDTCQLNRLQKGQYLRLKLRHDLHKISFNAGVCSMPSSIIKDDTFNNLCRMYHENVELFSAHMFDQALLNFYFYDNWTSIPCLYNIFVNFDLENYNRRSKKIRAFVLHFAGKDKCWDLNNSYYREWQSLNKLSKKFHKDAQPSLAVSMKKNEVETYAHELFEGWEARKKLIQKKCYWQWRRKKIFEKCLSTFNNLIR